MVLYMWKSLDPNHKSEVIIRADLTDFGMELFNEVYK